MTQRRRLFLLSIPIFALLLMAAWIYATMLRDLPAVSALDERAVRPTTRILDRNGRLLYEVLDPEAGKQISLALAADEESAYGLAGVPKFCVQAALATEDSRFYWHPGVDPIAIARAALQNWRADGQIVSGGSTLTQQVARNLLLDPTERYERTLRRKIREAWLALQLEWRYSKTEILQLYLNQTYYGYFAFGLEAAAQNFFAKPAVQLSRAECALLAGLVQYPGGYDPFVDAEAAKLRQRTVLRLMRDAGFITEDEVESIYAQPLRYRSRLFSIQAPHFVVYVQDLLLRELGVERLRDGGLDVITTLDLGLQREAERAVRHRLDQLNCRLQNRASTTAAICDREAERQVRNAAVVVLDAETGDVLAMVGSPDYFDPSIQGNVNAALSQRQPGSAIKPFTYAAAMDPQWSAELGLDPLTPASILPDLPTVFPGGRGAQTADGAGEGSYVPKNYDLRYHGPVSVREALANSYNVPAVKVLQRIGVPALQRLATQAGIGSFTGEYGLALTLGGGEVSLLDLTTAYGIFPREGRRLETRAIMAMVLRTHSVIGDRGSGTGDREKSPASIARSPIPDPQSLITPETAYLITDILSDRVARIPAFGEGSVLDLPFVAAAKTGTTTDWRDNWTVGYSSRRIVGVWVGNADNAPMRGITGIDGAGPIWHDVMLAAHPTPPPPFRRPARIVEETICAPSGLLPTPECPRTRRERFIAGTEPTRPDDQFQRIAIDLATGLRATEQTPATRRQERVYWVLGPEYADWMQAQGIPAPPPVGDRGPGIGEQARLADAAQTSNPRSPIPNPRSPILSAPIHNSAYALHPGVPPERQRIPVGGYAADGQRWHSLRLVVDGEIVLSAQNAARLDGWWTLQPGEHRFWLEGERVTGGETIYSAEALVVVE